MRNAWDKYRLPLAFVVAAEVLLYSVAGAMAPAGAQVNGTALQLSSDAGAGISATTLAVIAVIIPLCVGLYVARNSFTWVKRLLGLGS